MCLYKICKILCESRMMRWGSDIRGFWDPNRRKIEGIYDENSTDETYFILFKDEFEKKNNKCFMWMFKIFNGKREDGIKRYRRKENIYMIWEYLFNLKKIKEKDILKILCNIIYKYISNMIYKYISNIIYKYIISDI